MHLIGFPELRKKLAGRSRNAIFGDIDRGLLPPPMKFSKGNGAHSYWSESAVDAALSKLLPAALAQTDTPTDEGSFRDCHSKTVDQSSSTHPTSKGGR